MSTNMLHQAQVRGSLPDHAGTFGAAYQVIIAAAIPPLSPSGRDA